MPDYSSLQELVAAAEAEQQELDKLYTPVLRKQDQQELDLHLSLRSRPASALKWRRVQAADGPAMRV